MKNKKGLTLVEILIVMSIIAILAVMLISILNAIGITNRARDAQRKKDLNRVKVAFEEYFSDKGYFPNADLVGQLNQKSNCGSGVFKPYLNQWPCDPNGNPYRIFTELNRFRVVVNLENKTDKDIPSGWYQKNGFNLRGLTIDDVNYGVSSTNILWYENMAVDPVCDINYCSFKYANNPNSCSHNSLDPGCNESNGDTCYFGSDCNSLCTTSCCGVGCN